MVATSSSHSSQMTRAGMLQLTLCSMGRIVAMAVCDIRPGRLLPLTPSKSWNSMVERYDTVQEFGMQAWD